MTAEQGPGATRLPTPADVEAVSDYVFHHTLRASCTVDVALDLMRHQESGGNDANDRKRQPRLLLLPEQLLLLYRRPLTSPRSSRP